MILPQRNKRKNRHDEDHRLSKEMHTVLSRNRYLRAEYFDKFHITSRIKVIDTLMLLPVLSSIEMMIDCFNVSYFG